MERTEQYIDSLLNTIRTSLPNFAKQTLSDALKDQAADAQATIAALEETILKMGENAAVVAKDAMAAKEQIAALQAERDEYKTMYACLTGETYDNPIADLKAQLTQRTAELEAANKLLYRKNCALGRAETIINDLQAELERVRALIKALPKVEGEIQATRIPCAAAICSLS